MGGRYRSQAGVRATEDGMPAIMAMREEESCVPMAHAGVLGLAGNDGRGPPRFPFRCHTAGLANRRRFYTERAVGARSEWSPGVLAGAFSGHGPAGLSGAH